MFNYTIRPLLWLHKKNKQGLCPVVIAVTVNRKITYLSTPYKITENQWKDKEVTDHVNKKYINADIRKRIADIERRLIELNLSGIPLTANILKADHGAVSFVQYATTVRKDQKEINRVIDYAGAGLLLSEINVKWLREYEKHERKRGMSQNTLNTTFKYLRRIVSQAYKEKIIKENPFEFFDIPKYIQTDRVYLTIEEIKELVKLLDKDLPPVLYSTLCWFLLGCYTGLRHSDWVRFDVNKMVEDGFVKLRAKKNKSFVVLPVGPTLKNILKRIKSIDPPIALQTCNEKLKVIAAKAGINKEITTHTGRHSFGCMCASLGLDRSVTAELLGVTEQTVEVYYHLTGQRVMENAAVLAGV